MKRQTKPKSADNTTYSRLVGKDSDDEENTEIISLPKSTFKEIPTIDKELEEGDTLQNLAIRYHSTIHELKRLNKIQNENEIYAKRYIKVPHRPFAMLLAANNMATVHTSGSTSPIKMDDLLELNSDHKMDENILESMIKPLDVDNSLLTIPIDNGLKLNAVIFNSTVSTTNQSINNTAHNLSVDSEFIYNTSHQQLQSSVVRDDATVHAIQSVAPLAEPSVPRKSKVRVVTSNWLWDGADADISWIALIACVVVLILAVPLIYVLYIAEHPDLYHHDHPGHHHNKTWTAHEDIHHVGR